MQKSALSQISARDVSLQRIVVSAEVFPELVTGRNSKSAIFDGATVFVDFFNFTLGKVFKARLNLEEAQAGDFARGGETD